MMRISIWLVAALTGILLGSPLFAAGADPAFPGPGPAAERPLPPLPSERIDAELAYLKTALKVTVAQAPQWNALAAALRDMAKQRDDKVLAMRAEMVARSHPPADPIAQLERRQHDLAEEADALGKLLAAAKPLYASLDADQRRTADTLLLPIGLPHPPGMPGPMGPMPPLEHPFPD